MDALASSFVEGQLWKKSALAVAIESRCHCCQRPLRLEVDGERVLRVEDGAAPRVFLPIVDFDRWRGPSIIDGF